MLVLQKLIKSSSTFLGRNQSNSWTVSLWRAFRWRICCRKIELNFPSFEKWDRSLHGGTSVEYQEIFIQNRKKVPDSPLL
jgi:hypothetical protein